jgi:hypothetical protein
MYSVLTRRKVAPLCSLKRAGVSVKQPTLSASTAAVVTSMTMSCAMHGSLLTQDESESNKSNKWFARLKCKKILPFRLLQSVTPAPTLTSELAGELFQSSALKPSATFSSPPMQNLGNTFRFNAIRFVPFTHIAMDPCCKPVVCDILRGVNKSYMLAESVESFASVSPKDWPVLHTTGNTSIKLIVRNTVSTGHSVLKSATPEHIQQVFDINDADFDTCVIIKPTGLVGKMSQFSLVRKCLKYFTRRNQTGRHYVELDSAKHASNPFLDDHHDKINKGGNSRNVAVYDTSSKYKQKPGRLSSAVFKISKLMKKLTRDPSLEHRKFAKLGKQTGSLLQQRQLPESDINISVNNVVLPSIHLMQMTSSSRYHPHVSTLLTVENPLDRLPTIQLLPLPNIPVIKETLEPMVWSPAPKRPPVRRSRPPVKKRPPAKKPSLHKKRPASRKPAPRRSSVSRKPAPRKPSMTRKPAPRRSSVSRKPAPRKPSVTRKPAPRRSSVSRKPAPRKPSVVRKPPTAKTSRKSVPSNRRISASRATRSRSPAAHSAENSVRKSRPSARKPVPQRRGSSKLPIKAVRSKSQKRSNSRANQRLVSSAPNSRNVSRRPSKLSHSSTRRSKNPSASSRSNASRAPVRNYRAKNQTSAHSSVHAPLSQSASKSHILSAHQSKAQLQKSRGKRNEANSRSPARMHNSKGARGVHSGTRNRSDRPQRKLPSQPKASKLPVRKYDTKGRKNSHLAARSPGVFSASKSHPTSRSPSRQSHTVAKNSKYNKTGGHHVGNSKSSAAKGITESQMMSSTRSARSGSAHSSGKRSSQTAAKAKDHQRDADKTRSRDGRRSSHLSPAQSSHKSISRSKNPREKTDSIPLHHAQVESKHDQRKSRARKHRAKDQEQFHSDGSNSEMDRRSKLPHSTPAKPNTKPILNDTSQQPKRADVNNDHRNIQSHQSSEQAASKLYSQSKQASGADARFTDRLQSESQVLDSSEDEAGRPNSVAYGKSKLNRKSVNRHSTMRIPQKSAVSPAEEVDEMLTPELEPVSEPSNSAQNVLLSGFSKPSDTSYIPKPTAPPSTLMIPHGTFSTGRGRASAPASFSAATTNPDSLWSPGSSESDIAFANPDTFVKSNPVHSSFTTQKPVVRAALEPIINQSPDMPADASLRLPSVSQPVHTVTFPREVGGADSMKMAFPAIYSQEVQEPSSIQNRGNLPPDFDVTNTSKEQGYTVISRVPTGSSFVRPKSLVKSTFDSSGDQFSDKRHYASTSSVPLPGKTPSVKFSLVPVVHKVSPVKAASHASSNEQQSVKGEATEKPAQSFSSAEESDEASKSSTQFTADLRSQISKVANASRNTVSIPPSAASISSAHTKPLGTHYMAATTSATSSPSVVLKPNKWKGRIEKFSANEEQISPELVSANHVSSLPSTGAKTLGSSPAGENTSHAIPQSSHFVSTVVLPPVTVMTGSSPATTKHSDRMTVLKPAGRNDNMLLGLLPASNTTIAGVPVTSAEHSELTEMPAQMPSTPLSSSKRATQSTKQERIYTSNAASIPLPASLPTELVFKSEREKHHTENKTYVPPAPPLPPELATSEATHRSMKITASRLPVLHQVLPHDVSEVVPVTPTKNKKTKSPILLLSPQLATPTDLASTVEYPLKPVIAAPGTPAVAAPVHHLAPALAVSQAGLKPACAVPGSLSVASPTVCPLAFNTQSHELSANAATSAMPGYSP